MFITSIYIKKKKWLFLSFSLILLSSFLALGSFFVTKANSETQEEKNYIKWVDFTPTYAILEKTAKLDMESHKNPDAIPLNWIELLAYLASKSGGNFRSYQSKDLDTLVSKLKNRRIYGKFNKGPKILFLLL